MIGATLLFLITLSLIIWQPKGLQIGTTAMLGALTALLFGIVSFDDVVTVFSIIWDATLAFIGIIILSMVLDAIGFFEWTALKMAHFAKGSGTKMFLYSVLLGAFVAALFANDGAALILTPILLAKMKILRLNTKTILAFLLAGGFISDAASLPFVFSNLTNIVTADYFDIGFLEFSRNMFFAYFVSVFVSLLFLYIIFHKDIPRKINTQLLAEPNSVLKDYKLFQFSWFFLLFLLLGYIVGDMFKVPISLFALSGALLFLFIASRSGAVVAKDVIKEAPWQIVWFSLGLYVVVYGLKNAGLTDELGIILSALNQHSHAAGVIGTGFIAAILSALMNNMPTIMVMDIALEHIGNDAMIYANIIGCNLGPKMTPFGSLATLLWLHSLEKKGIQISFWNYTKFGLLITPPVLLLVLLALL
jgi:arsenical pump membrane protein